MGAREVDLKNFFKGAATALVTPFDGREVNYAVLEKLIARQIKAGNGALAVLGTTGEAATVTKKERREIFAFCVRIRNKYDETRRTKLIFGCGANDTREAVKNTEIAAKLAEIPCALPPTAINARSGACTNITAKSARRRLCPLSPTTFPRGRA